MKLPVYLDYAATTPVDERVAQKMQECLTQEGNFGNPASRSHIYGWRAEESVENARAQVAALLNTDPRSIVWTSGATESNNLAIKGAAFHELRADTPRRHIITSAIEHKSVLDTVAYLEAEGFRVTFLQPNDEGMIFPQQVADAIEGDTFLVSLMHVNNEIGTITDIAAVGELCRERNVLFHVDAAQSTGKVDIDLAAIKVDLMSLSAHKTYGPKGVGALYVCREPRAQIEALIHGGGHERGMRSGTLPTHQLVGMGEAYQIAGEQMQQDNQHLLQLRDQFINGLKQLDEVFVNGNLEHRIAGNANICFSHVDGETLLLGLKDIAISSGSACTSATVEPSYVLKAMGLSHEEAYSSIRFSFGRYTTEKDIDTAVGHIVTTVNKLRELSPQWQQFKSKASA